MNTATTTPTVKVSKSTTKVTKSTNPVGRPRTTVKLILNKSFSLKDLQTLNPLVKKMTLRAHVLRGVKNGQFTKLNRTVLTGLKGKPSHLFINTKVLAANLANLGKTKEIKAKSLVTV